VLLLEFWVKGRVRVKVTARGRGLDWARFNVPLDTF